MKKVIVMSDNHGQAFMMERIKELEANADFYVHCGDSETVEETLKGWIAVSGNNDWQANLPNSLIFTAGEVRFLVCHGHRFGYFNREEYMIEVLRENNCQVLLSGHTHVPQCEYIEGHYLVNPGSTTLPRRGSAKSYCVITVDNENIDIQFKELS